MSTLSSGSILKVTFVFSVLVCNACVALRPPSPAPAAIPVADDALAEIQLLEERVRRDAEDFAAYNRLSGRYLQRARALDDETYLDRARGAAETSLAIMPAERNTGGLYALARYKQATHDFAAARDHAEQLIQLQPGRSDPYLVLGDALLELGDYAQAAEAFQTMQRMKGGLDVQVEMRLARLAALHGDRTRAKHHFRNALQLVRDLPVPPRDAIVWCHWQLGETAFAAGDYKVAERHYRDALTASPDDRNTLASLARVRAARGDVADAIALYEQVVRRAPHPEFTAPLGDLYKLTGREQEAAELYRQVEQVGRESAHDNRLLALFYANHDMNPEEAYARAAKEHSLRRDIETCDVLAWTALKAGRIAEAQKAMGEALRLGTQEARFFYHAGMIAQATGDETAARDYLRRALALNPRFDPLGAAAAEVALQGLSRRKSK